MSVLAVNITPKTPQSNPTHSGAHNILHDVNNKVFPNGGQLVAYMRDNKQVANSFGYFVPNFGTGYPIKDPINLHLAAGTDGNPIIPEANPGTPGYNSTPQPNLLVTRVINNTGTFTNPFDSSTFKLDTGGIVVLVHQPNSGISTQQINAQENFIWNENNSDAMSMGMQIIQNNLWGTAYGYYANVYLSPAPTVTISIAYPAVVTLANHGLFTGLWGEFGTTGALPTGLSAGTDYTIVKKDANNFWVSQTPVLGIVPASIVAGNPTTINTTGAHGLSSGQHVAICFSTAVPSLDLQEFVITVTSPTQFTIPVLTTVGQASTAPGCYVLALVQTTIAGSGTHNFRGGGLAALNPLLINASGQDRKYTLGGVANITALQIQSLASGTAPNNANPKTAGVGIWYVNNDGSWFDAGIAFSPNTTKNWDIVSETNAVCGIDMRGSKSVGYDATNGTFADLAFKAATGFGFGVVGGNNVMSLSTGTGLIWNGSQIQHYVSSVVQAILDSGGWHLTGYQEMQNQASVPTPIAGHVILWCRDNPGSPGKSQLVATFHTGAIQVVASEP